MTAEITEGLKNRLGDPGEALHRKQRMDRNVRYALAHLDQWRTEHPNAWIAVFDERLIAAESSRERLIWQVGESGVPLSETYVDFISEDKTLLVI